MRKTIEIQCDPSISTILITALRNYTDVAFPEHSSDCAQVARSAMVDAVDTLERELAATGNSSYNKRLRAMFKEGIKLYYQIAVAETGNKYLNEENLMLELCQGKNLTDAQLAEARSADDRTE